MKWIPYAERLILDSSPNFEYSKNILSQELKPKSGGLTKINTVRGYRKWNEFNQILFEKDNYWSAWLET